MLKLNLGCGFKQKDGFENVDQFQGCDPQVLCDLANEKWPWEDSTVSEAHFDFSLEQMGETKTHLLHILKELYRVSKNEAVVKVNYIHPRHDQFLNNPLCVHRLSPEFFNTLSVQRNLSMIGSGESDSCLALMLGVNFELKEVKPYLDASLQRDFQAGGITQDDISKRLYFENNICHVVSVDLRVSKGNG